MDKKFRELYAIKKFRKSSLTSDRIRECFKSEIEVMRELIHPNICRLSRVLEDQRSFSMCMPYYSGGTLLEKCRRSKLSVEQLRSIMRQILSGIDQIHSKGFMHRDIKPENILFKKQQSNEIVIIDFGLAAQFTNESQRYVKCGTPGYVAPEMFKCSQSNPYDQKVDMFSAGIVFYMMLARQIPYSAKEQDELKKQNFYFTFNPKDPQLENLSCTALSLLEQVLERNPKLRLSAKQALNHPFFQKYTSESMEKICSITKVSNESSKVNF